MQIAAAVVAPPRSVAPSPSCVVRPEHLYNSPSSSFCFVTHLPPTSPLCVPVLILKQDFWVFDINLCLNLKSQTVVALTAATAETSLVVVPLVVVALVVIALVVVVAWLLVSLVLAWRAFLLSVK